MHWLIQVCQAIEAAHQAGVVHGNLTPNNVLVAKDGRIVVTDFGFSTHLHPPTKVSDPQLSLAPLGGTLGFAAPEQVSPAFGHISPATDIYAIGGVAHFLLTGLGPHDSKVSLLMGTISDDDVEVAKSPRNAAESKLASVASRVLKKAINRGPKSATQLLAVHRSSSERRSTEPRYCDRPRMGDWQFHSRTSQASRIWGSCYGKRND